MPVGGGELLLSAAAIRSLQPIELTEFGKICRVSVNIKYCGEDRDSFAAECAEACRIKLTGLFPDAELNVELCDITPGGNKIPKYTGIDLWLQTTTGCLLGVPPCLCFEYLDGWPFTLNWLSLLVILV